MALRLCQSSLHERFWNREGRVEGMTDRLALPLMIAGQGQKEVTHNEALILLEWYALPTVRSRSEPPPSEAASGDAWLIPGTATGEPWESHRGQVAVRWGGDWRFIVPAVGVRIYIEDEDSYIFLLRDGGWRVEPALVE